MRKLAGRIEAQSAMEYLLMYGWAILSIAIVLAALFELGLFNSGATSLRAFPGSCRVFRPGGAYSSSSAVMLGQCASLAPQFVQDFGYAYRSGLGYGYVSVPNLPLDMNGAGVTATMWVYWLGPVPKCQGILGSSPSPGTGFAVFGYGYNNGGCGPVWINASYLKWPNGNYSIPAGRWEFIAVSYNETSGYAAMYVDMQVFSNATKQPLRVQESNAFTLGAVIGPNGNIYTFNGLVTNVQVYDQPLPQNSLDALYQEGIGGAPIDLQDLVGWWPLNGNANDYSGNNNNGQLAGSASFNGTWTTLYPPT